MVSKVTSLENETSDQGSDVEKFPETERSEREGLPTVLEASWKGEAWKNEAAARPEANGIAN